MKLSLAIISVVILLIMFPSVSGVQKVLGNEVIKSGDAGEVVKYEYWVQNDHDYSIDILLKIEHSEWKVEIIKEEIKDVPRKAEVSFEILITIPQHPDSNQSITKLAFWEKESIADGDDFLPISPTEYKRQWGFNLTTNLKQSTDIISTSEIVANNSLLFSLILLLSASLGYVWHGRKYFFLAPFYMNIPKEKLLDNENREKISHYLSQYNGSNLSEISHGTGIHVQTLRHHMRLFEQSNLVLKKEKRFFMRKPGSDVFDTEILSPILQRVFGIIRENDGISVSQLIGDTKRSKPWIGNRLNDLLTLDLIEIVKVGRFKYIYPKGQSPQADQSRFSQNTQPMVG